MTRNNSNTTPKPTDQLLPELNTLSDESSLENSEEGSEYDWLDDTGIKIYVKGIPDDVKANVVAEIVIDSSKDFTQQISSTLCSEIPDAYVPEILQNNLDEIININNEDFASQLSYPLLKRFQSWNSAEGLESLKNKIKTIASSFGFTSDNIERNLEVLDEYTHY